MAITLAELAANTASVAFPYGESTVNVIYRPAMITEETLASLNTFESAGADTVLASFKSLNETLATIIASWDAYEDAAQTQMIALAPERLAKLPIAFRIAAFTAILGDFRPNLPTA